MDRALRYGWWALTRACLVLGAAAGALGCHTAYKGKKAAQHGHHENLHIDNCSDIPQGAIPQPVGTYTSEYLLRQAAKAEADDYVVYYNEWLDGTTTLSQWGNDHLARIAAKLPSVPFPVIVQPEPNEPRLSFARREAMVALLLQAGIPDAANRVFVGRPTAEGLFGEEAERIYPQLLQGGFNGFGGGFGGGGFGLNGGFGLGGGFGGGGFGFGGGFGAR